MEDVLAPAGWHVALTGGVLQRSQSSHDLDVVIYPHCRSWSRQPRITEARAALRKIGMHLRVGRSEVVSYWRKKGSKDRKWVEVWVADDKRVDLLVLS